MTAPLQPASVPVLGATYEHLTAHSIWTCTAIDYNRAPLSIQLQSGLSTALVSPTQLDTLFRIAMPRCALGQHTGGGAAGAAAIGGVETELKRTLDFAIDFGANVNIESAAYRFLEWPAPRKLALAVYLAPTGGTANMQTAATGGYDALYQTACEDLAANQARVLAVRIGWECNTPNFPWGVGGSGSNQSAANYIAAFRRYAAILRNLCPGMAIDWNVQWDWPSPESYYPGDDVVDIVSTDLYPQAAFHSPYSWADVIARPSSLTWLDGFAAAHNKKMAIPEWGTDFDPSDFVPRVAEWIDERQGRVAYNAYWNEAGGPNVALNQHPGVKAQYLQSWGRQP